MFQRHLIVSAACAVAACAIASSAQAGLLGGIGGGLGAGIGGSLNGALQQGTLNVTGAGQEQGSAGTADTGLLHSLSIPARSASKTEKNTTNKENNGAGNTAGSAAVTGASATGSG